MTETRLILTGGLPGSGKTARAAQLAQERSAVRLSERDPDFGRLMNVYRWQSDAVDVEDQPGRGGAIRWRRERSVQGGDEAAG